MRVWTTIRDGLVTVRARAEGDQVVGDAVWEVRPGESLLGLAYGEWAELGEGEHEVETIGDEQE